MQISHNKNKTHNIAAYNIIKQIEKKTLEDFFFFFEVFYVMHVCAHFANLTPHSRVALVFAIHPPL